MFNYNTDKHLIEAVIEHYGLIKLMNNNDLQFDRNYVLKHIQYGHSLRNIKRIMIDKELALLALKNYITDYDCLIPELQADKDICLYRLNLANYKRNYDYDDIEHADIWSNIPDSLKNDEKILIKAFKNDFIKFKQLPESLKCNKEILIHRALNNKINPEWQDDQELINLFLIKPRNAHYDYFNTNEFNRLLPKWRYFPKYIKIAIYYKWNYSKLPRLITRNYKQKIVNAQIDIKLWFYLGF